MGAIDLSNGFLFPATEHGKVERVQPVHPGIAGVEFQSLLVLSLASGKIPVVLHIVAAEYSMGIGQGRVQLQCLAGGSIGFWIVFAGTATSKAMWVLKKSVIGMYSWLRLTAPSSFSSYL